MCRHQSFDKDLCTRQICKSRIQSYNDGFFKVISKVGSVGLFSEEDGRLRQVTLISSVFSHEFAKSAFCQIAPKISL